MEGPYTIWTLHIFSKQALSYIFYINKFKALYLTLSLRTLTLDPLN
jgi:hypothetical protein